MLYNDDEPINSKAAKKKKRGFLITFEGIDGTGKTTQIAGLVSCLGEMGVKTLTLREPGGTDIGESIRRILLDKDHAGMYKETEMLLFAAARAQLVREVIKPALAEGTWVICSRYLDSSLAYQGYGRGMGLEIIREINSFAVDDCRPDLTFLLDIPVEIAAERLAARDNHPDRIENAGLAFMQKTRDGYLALAAKETNRIILLDTRKKQDEIGKEIISIIKEGFGI